MIEFAEENCACSLCTKLGDSLVISYIPNGHRINLCGACAMELHAQMTVAIFQAMAMDLGTCPQTARAAKADMN